MLRALRSVRVPLSAAARVSRGPVARACSTKASRASAGAAAAATVAAVSVAGVLCASASEASADDSAEELTPLYPALEARVTGRLKVSDVHELYWEESGNPDGKPVVFLHGGPGGGSQAKYRSFFDPAKYRIIMFDQRGCGKSTPHANLEENTTWTLVDDIERLRNHLGVDKWQVFGGSWGSTLALSYAITHPDRVTELVLRGIFMLRRSELEWYYQDGASHIFPDRWEQYRDAISPDERGDFIAAYRKCLTGDDEAKKVKCARAWTAWEMTTSELQPSAAKAANADDDLFSIAFARIENHFFTNGGFFPKDEFLLDNVYKIRHIPTVIVQGRYDVVCPARSAWDLHRRFPEADLRIIGTAGHSCFEPGIRSELVKATDAFARS